MGGWIGAELSRQIARFGPRRIVLFELSEFALFRTEQEFPRPPAKRGHHPGHRRCEGRERRARAVRRLCGVVTQLVFKAVPWAPRADLRARRRASW
ncbi:MAG TPA: polysaccharide biosynthesis protein [Burkholderiales bacterium]|nr:polysaccharide biosynthesis protein [Burkholderiales bacterium]